MMHRRELTEEQIQHTIDTGELPDEVVREHPQVAVILTQGWCPQWKSMDVWLSAAHLKAEPQGYELSVPFFVYDKSPLFKKFRKFKEKVWGNHHVPYVRYYKDGKLIDESNYLPSREFFSKFAAADHSPAEAAESAGEL